MKSRPTVIVGTSAVALILAASRWGTNIGASPIYITDILIGLGIAGWFIATRMQGKRALDGWVTRNRPSALFALFFVYVSARFLLSLGGGPMLDWVRDGVPFLYGVLAFVSASSLARSTHEARARTMRIFWAALIFHTLWACVIIFGGIQETPSVPFSTAPLFQLRPDIDAALLGVTAGMCLLRILRGHKKFWPFIGMVASAAAVLTLETRAGLIALALSVALAILLQYAATPRQNVRRTVMVMVIPALALIALMILPTTPPGERLVATFKSSQGSTSAAESAQGTQRARELVWSGVIDWTNEETSRTIFGGGFGNNFLDESGTLAYLEGSTYSGVRSPHNWFVGNYARLGVIGFALSIAVCLQLLGTIVRYRRRIGEDPLLSLSALLIVAILPVASFGVVLEAPHGAVPFWWAAGIIFALRESKTKAAGLSQVDSSPAPAAAVGRGIPAL
ncbi:O-antigen ligase family protein [Cryobacterium psychrophilum]|uniref:O-antigen ligase family protein n=1 Tax=Cryobacterium psychrophilum TaxID=41988 RepID=UPI001416F9A4|nr:O-antigen ligase family protein [Cryobacterium psychrophilum]